MTASAEDLLVLKAFADRNKDWQDIQGIMARQRDNLNWEQILSDLAGQCELKEDATPLEKLEVMRLRVQRGRDNRSFGI